MKIEVNIDRKFLVFSLLIGLLFVGFVGVYAYNSAGAPAVMGHSVNEVDWSQTIAGSVKAGGFCIGANCITAWPSAGANLVAGSGIILTSVNGGMMINATATGSGGGADTRCDVSGVCSQVCIGSSCINSWKITMSYYVGVDNNGNNDPDCWLDGGAGNGTGWGGCNQNQDCCARSSVARKASATGLDINFESFSDTGSSSPILGDSSSDKLLVVVSRPAIGFAGWI